MAFFRLELRHLDAERPPFGWRNRAISVGGNDGNEGANGTTTISAVARLASLGENGSMVGAWGA
jgi:hypothetical protein